MKRALLMLLMLAVSSAYAQNPPAGALANVGMDQRLSERVPLEISLRDETGRSVLLGDFFGKKPVILLLVYYQCPMLCGIVLNGVMSSARTLDFVPGKDFEVVAVSFDPSEKPPLAFAKKQYLLEQHALTKTAAGWHFLTGDAAAIRALTDAVGFRYSWDEQTQQWAHPSGLMVVTPQGRLSRYLFGVEYAPRDVRLALVEAGEGKIGSIMDRAWLYCYHYDPLTGRYGFAIMTVVRIAGIATVLLLGLAIAKMLRRGKEGKVLREV